MRMYKLSVRSFSALRPFILQCRLHTLQEKVPLNIPSYMTLSKDLNTNFQLAESFINSLSIHYDFITDNEEKTLLDEIEPYMKKLHYEFDHWDNAIHGYRETERLQWTEENTKILNRVRSIAFPPGVAQLKYVHILDLDKKGYIKPHVDAVRFCGNTIAGLSLLTDSVMRLVHEKHPELYADVLLKKKSLYIMTGSSRYDYTHEILSNDNSSFKEEKVFKDRRISVICRNEPDPSSKNT